MYYNENIMSKCLKFFTLTLNEWLQGDSKKGLGKTNDSITNELFIHVHKCHYYSLLLR
jgi:hypothetical protein